MAARPLNARTFFFLTLVCGMLLLACDGKDGESAPASGASSEATLAELEGGLAEFLEGMAVAAEIDMQDCKKQEINIQMYMNGQVKALEDLRRTAQSLRASGKLDKSKTDEIKKAVKGELSVASNRFKAAIIKRCEFNKLAVIYPSLAVFASDEELDRYQRKN